MAIPLKRQMITVEKLVFPYSVSVGETLKAIYSKGDVAVRKAKSLGAAGLIGIVIASLRDGAGWIPALWQVPGSIAKVSLAKLTLSFEPGMIMMGIGAIFGIKAGVSMLLGVLLNYGVLAPILINEKIITHPAPAIQGTATVQIPLTLYSGEELRFVIEQAVNSPEMNGGGRTDTISYVWSDTVTYYNLASLKSDLNGEILLSGEINPLYGYVAFSDTLNKNIMDQVLIASAPNLIHWEASLTVPFENGSRNTAELLGFMPGDSNFQAVGGYRNIVAWSMWPGVGVLVVSGILAFAMQYKTLGRTFGSMTSGFRRKKKKVSDVMEGIEVPGKWFLVGFIVTGIPTVILQKSIFGISYWLGSLAVLVTFFLAAVAARTAAEVGINPIGAMGKVTQLLYGILSPGNMTTNLMAANVTAGAACTTSDTLSNLKVGHMVGANPRKQFIAQMFGVIAGSLACVPAYYILVPDVNILGSDQFPAPSAIVWAGVARLLARGLSTLPPSAIWALVIASIFAVIVVLVDKFFPKAKKYTPSCAAIGIALTIPGWNSIAMFAGALAAEIFMHVNKDADDLFRIPIASGFIAGESLAGVAVAALMAMGVIG